MPHSSFTVCFRILKSYFCVMRVLYIQIFGLYEVLSLYKVHNLIKRRKKKRNSKTWKYFGNKHVQNMYYYYLRFSIWKICTVWCTHSAAGQPEIVLLKLYEVLSCVPMLVFVLIPNFCNECPKSYTNFMVSRLWNRNKRNKRTLA